jgi:enoyl-CoA hydratase
MLTGDSITVDEAHRIGMVSKVFPREQLQEKTLEFARRIAKLPTMTSLAPRPTTVNSRAQVNLV